MRTGLRRATLAIGKALVRLGAPGKQLVLLHYPVDLSGRPENETIRELYGAREPEFERVLAELVTAAGEDAPALQPGPNTWISPLDAFVLGAFVLSRRPCTYLEIGSGVSTTVVRRAIDARGLETRIVSIDPHPRAEIDALCDEVVRSRLEDADLAVFERLEAGDMVFFDGSHYTFPGGDVPVFMLEVVPRLAPGVLVGIHDIHLPRDYPDWQRVTYPSEAYVVGAWLLGGGIDRVRLPVAWAASSDRLRAVAEPVAGDAEGVGFWFET